MPSFASPHPRYQHLFLASVQQILDPALLTCDADNVGSRRVIESDGGVLEDQREDKLRFWVPTSV